MSPQNPQEMQDDTYLAPDEGEEIIEKDEDHPMDSDPEDNVDLEGQEIAIENDSSAHFDIHTDSVFCIAQHPRHSAIVITGSGDDTAYLFDSTPLYDRPLLPQSYESDPHPMVERKSIQSLAKMDGHTDTVNAVTFTEPNGEYAVTAGLDGRLRVWRDTSPQLTGLSWEFVAESQEVEEINWVAACPCADRDDEKSNVVALGANDGSVWVFHIDHRDTAEPISIVQTFFQHTGSCTAGSWTPDGNLLATVSEDASLFVYDAFGAAAAAGFPLSAGTNAVIGLTADDQRFLVDGGLYSVAVAPSGTFLAVGGAGGHIRIVGLPRLISPTGKTTSSRPQPKSASSQPAGSSSTVGTLLASLQAQTDGIETLSFSAPPLNLLASGSVDGSIALFDTSHRFAVRRHIKEAHETGAVVKVEFLRGRSPVPAADHHRPAASATADQRPWLLTSVGMDGVVKRWDARGGTAAAAQGLLKEWRGHMGLFENEEGEQSGGIMGFVQSPDGKRIVTAGDDGVVLVFDE